MKETSIVKAGLWYKCIKSIPEKYFNEGGIYKCNLENHLQNDTTNNVTVTLEEQKCFAPHSITVESKMNHMPYYEQGRKITPFDVIIDWNLDFFTGNVIKYIARLGRKPSELSKDEKSIEDLQKAKVYLEKEIELLTKRLKNE